MMTIIQERFTSMVVQNLISALKSLRRYVEYFEIYKVI